MLSTLWPKVTPDTEAQALLRMVAMRLFIASAVVLAATFGAYFFQSHAPSFSLKSALAWLVTANVYLVNTYSMVLLAGMSLFMSSLVHLRSIVLLMSLNKSNETSGAVFPKALQLGKASRVATRLHNAGALVMLFFTVSVNFYSPVLQTSAVATTGIALALAVFIPMTPLILHAFLPVHAVHEGLILQVTSNKGEGYNDLLDHGWSTEALGLTTTPQGLVYLIARRAGRLSDYRLFYKIVHKETAPEPSSSSPRNSFQH